MRIFFASDLHYDVAIGPSGTAALAEWVCSEGTAEDVLLLGGDYANSDEKVRECLEHFEGFPGDKLAIAGNHDVWVVDTDDERSRERYDGLSEIYAEFGIHPLEDEPVNIGGVGFVGAMGWYDYTFRVESLDVPLEVYERKGFPGVPGPVWNDGRNVNWGIGDPDFTDEQLTRLEQQLDAVSDAESVVVMTHHVPTTGLLRPQFLPETVPRRIAVPRKWLILNTYLGSQRFEELLARHAERIDVAFCGHIHLSREAERSRVRFVSNGSDHKHKELVTYEAGELTRRSFS